MSDDPTPREPAPSATLSCAAGVSPETLSAWRDGLLSADEAVRLASHTLTCPACGARLREYDAIGAALREQIIPRSAADPWPAMRRRIEDEDRGRRGRLAALPRWGGLGALVAAALLVALFAGLLAQQATRRPALGATPTIAQTTPLATPLQTATPTGALWKQISGYSGVYGLSVSPTNPDTAYQFWFDSSGIILRRTDDAGATWHSLPVPYVAHATYPIIGTAVVLGMVNPFKPHTVYMGFYAQMDNSTAPCLPKNVIPAFCFFQFISQDSGAHWRQITLPISGSLGFPAMDDNTMQGQAETSVQPTATRLYSMLYPLDRSGARLVVNDGGMTWRLIDAPIAAAGQRVSSFAATPTGSTIFALSEPAGTQSSSSAPLTIWRSDDAGATWTNLGPAPSGTVMAMTAGLVASSGKPMLYLLTTSNPSFQSAYDIQGSLFGASGSFHVAPTPTPACSGAGNSYLLGMQHDGSVMIWCGGAVESWLASPVAEGWQTVATPPGIQTVQSAFIQTLPDGSRQLWLTTDDNVAVEVEYATLPN